MATYRSNLESLHRLRSAARDAQQQRVADAMRAEAALEEQAAVLATESAAAKQSQRDIKNNDLNVATLLEIERYESLLQSQQAAIESQKQQVIAELERRRADLAAAEQQVRVVEKLDDRRRNDFQRKELRRAQINLDEIASNRFIRKQRLS